MLIYQSKKVIEHTKLLLNSYKHWKHEDLIEANVDDKKLSENLYLAPFVVLSHDGAEDPVLSYGNQAALDLWGMTWDSFIHTPSRLTAEPIHRDERSGLLHHVAEYGFCENYSGIRISNSGKRFRIENAYLWTLIDEQGKTCGQAATFNKWTYLDPLG
ncbi:MAG: MEKHLA domain-containing protein [Deltaproteobacteria bacterium]|nr:MEKHLA domain-containing protein [Deltaproteobacteria bacterium]